MEQSLKINNCPRCSVDYPNMVLQNSFDTTWDNGDEKKSWGVYVCKRCGGAVLALTYPPETGVEAVYPSTETANSDLPADVRKFLDEAMRSIATPAASIMVCASAIDAMLKIKSYVKGGLYTRINEAVEDHLLTQEMGTWAHQVRLEANDQRHADQEAAFPTMVDAKRCVEFAKTLGEFLFVLPAKVTRGIQNVATPTPEKQKSTKPPKNIKFPNAYRKGGYSYIVNLEDSDEQPVVKAVLYYDANGRTLPHNQQLDELMVENRQGNPRWWQATLSITDCNPLPERTFLQISVDEVPYQVGYLIVSSVGR